MISRHGTKTVHSIYIDTVKKTTGTKITVNDIFVYNYYYCKSS